MLRTKELRYAYPNGPAFRFEDVYLPSNEHMLILGPSGVGKTTLLHLLAGLLPATEGSIAIGENTINNLQRKELDRFRGEHIGVIFQEYYFIKSLSVYENLALRLRFSKNKKNKARIAELLERLGLSTLSAQKATTLSKGQQQRLSIALGLVHQPKIILADEPTSNLDDQNCEAVIKLLKDEAELAKSSLVIITHDQRIKHQFNKTLVL